ncbi:MAG: hypothetical protein ACLTER_01175 [Ruminococcus sp.]
MQKQIYFYIEFVMPMIFLKMSEFGMALVGFLHVIFMLKIKGLEWERMKSRRYCKKMEVLFGVNDIEELKGKIEKCVYNSEISYLRGWDAAPAILNYIKVEDIGTLN